MSADRRIDELYGDYTTHEILSLLAHECEGATLPYHDGSVPIESAHFAAMAAILRRACVECAPHDIAIDRLRSGE